MTNWTVVRVYLVNSLIFTTKGTVLDALWIFYDNTVRYRTIWNTNTVLLIIHRTKARCVWYETFTGIYWMIEDIITYSNYNMIDSIINNILIENVIVRVGMDDKCISRTSIYTGWQGESPRSRSYQYDPLQHEYMFIYDIINLI